MSFEATRKAIWVRWKAAFTGTTVAGFTFFPEGGDHSEWLAKHAVVNIQQGASMPASLGNAKTTRIQGALIVQLFVKQGDGSKAFNEAADAIAAAFDNAVLRDGTTSIRFKTAALVDAGTRETWRQKNVVVPFERDTYN